MLRKRAARSARERRDRGRRARPATARAERGVQPLLLPLHGDAAAGGRDLAARPELARRGARRPAAPDRGHDARHALLRAAARSASPTRPAVREWPPGEPCTLAPLMAWFKRVRKPIAPPDKASRVPEGTWVKCPDCGQAHLQQGSGGELHVCPKCAHHFRLGADRPAAHAVRRRAGSSTTPACARPTRCNFIDTKPYTPAPEGRREGRPACSTPSICATGRIDGIETIVAAMEYGFIGGSMGVVVGEKITRAIERAHRRRGCRSSSCPARAARA